MKILVTFIFTLFLTIPLFSQSFGARIGANVANLTGDDIEGASIVSWQFGGFINIGLSENVDLNIAGLYSKKGAKDEMNDEVLDLSYLDIPIMLRFNVSALFLQAGAYGSFLLGADSAGVDIKDFLKGGDYGVHFGVGIRLDNIVIDGRYSFGMANINDISAESIKNSVITFGVEYGF